MTELVRVPSSKFYKLLDQIAENEKTTRDYFEEALALARREKFTDLEIALLMKDYLKDKIPKATLWRWTKALEPKEDIEESTSQSVPLEPNVEKKEPEQKPIPTINLVPDVEEYVKPPEVEEEPTELELANIKIAQLEDALHQTQQFTQATQLQQHEQNGAIDFLRERADGVHSFYYDAYGIDLFKNRELSQLKNSGVRVFKRLYFEV